MYIHIYIHTDILTNKHTKCVHTYIHMYIHTCIFTMTLFSGSVAKTPSSLSQNQSSNEAFVLSLPGKQLDVSSLVNKKKKFRSRGGRDGALSAMKSLEDNGLGKLVVKQCKGSIKVGVHIDSNSS